MNSLIRVLTQMIANDFLTDYEAVALGKANHNLLHQLIGSQYRIKRRVDYQIIPDRSTGCARLCEMDEGFSVEGTDAWFSKEAILRTVALSQTLTFSTPQGSQQEGKDEDKDEDEDEDDMDNTEDDRTPASPPLSLTLTRIDNSSTTQQYEKYHIGSIVHLRLARSSNPRKPITEILEIPSGAAIDSEDEIAEYEYYNYRKDDGRKGRPELAHFDFLPSSVKQLEISKTILLSPEVTMSTLHRVESLTLGVLWPWQLTPISASSYWPPQLKSLKFKRWIKDDLDDDDDGDDGRDNHREDIDDRDDTRANRFFGEIDIRQITFPSTLTELELPKRMSKLLNEDESKQLNAIQYPQGLIKLIHPFIPYRLAGWHLPESLTHLECHFDPNVDNDLDISQWRLPSSLLTLILIASRYSKLQLSSLQLPASLTSLALPPSECTESLESLLLPSTLTEFNFPYNFTLPLDWSHTSISSFTVRPPVNHHQPLSAFKLPSSVTRIKFSHYEHLPQIDADYVWPPQLSEVKLESNFRATAVVISRDGRTTKIRDADDAPFPLPSTLRCLVVATSLSGPFTQLKLPKGLESLSITAFSSQVAFSLSQFVPPSSLTSFTYGGTSTQLPSLAHTQLVTLELFGSWNHFSITRRGEFELPETLKSLRFGSDFNQPLDQLRLPAGLTELQFGVRFSQSLASLTSQIPQLRILKLGMKFAHLSSLMDLHLPISLDEIVLPAPASKGITLSSFHTRYTDFVQRLQDRLVKVKLIESQSKAKGYV